MNNAELYNKNNALQKRDTLECLEKFATKIKWKRHDARIIDIGCGDGSTTTQILKNIVPNNFGILVGGDVSEKMVSFANEHHGSQRVAFMALDIEEDLPPGLEGKFDHAFSFFVLHWIRGQKKAFTNIHKMLTEEGNCLVLFLGHMPIYDVFRVLAKNVKWNAYLKDLHRFISPYHDSQEPEKEIKCLMEKIGFKNVDVRNEEKSFVFDNRDNLEKAVKAVNPFDVPIDKWNDFLNDYIEVLKDMRMMDIVNNNHNEKFLVKCYYRVLIAVASK